MDRSRGAALHGRGIPAPARPGLRLISLLCALALASCDFPDPILPEHRDPARNWISAYGFDSFTDQPALIQEPAWYFGYAVQPDDAFDYVSLADTGTTVGADAVAGLPAEAAVYRLRIINLIQDPDLEAEAAPAPGPRFALNSAGDPPAAMTLVSSAPTSLHGNSLVFQRMGNEDWVSRIISTDLFNALAPGQGPVAGSRYQVNFLYRQDTAEGRLYYCYQSNTSQGIDPYEQLTADLLGESGNVNDIRTQPAPFMDPAKPYYLVLGRDSTQQGVFDDLRVTRLLIDLGLRIDLSPAACQPGLIPGRYRFSVWVRNDPEASDLELDENARDPYRPRALTLAIRTSTDWGSSGGIELVIPSPAGGYPTWTKVSAEMPAGEILDFQATSSSPVLSLHLYATNNYASDGRDPGSILVAQPELNFLLD